MIKGGRRGFSPRHQRTGTSTGWTWETDRVNCSTSSDTQTRKPSVHLHVDFTTDFREIPVFRIDCMFLLSCINNQFYADRSPLS